MALALIGLQEFNTIKAVIRGKEGIAIKDFRRLLKAEEKTVVETTKQIPLMSAMVAHPSAMATHPSAMASSAHNGMAIA